MYRKKEDLVNSLEYLNIATNHLERFIADIPDSCCLLAKCYKMKAANYIQLSDYEVSIICNKKLLETLEKHSPINQLTLYHDHTSAISETYQSLGRLYSATMDYDQSAFYYEKFVESSSIDQNQIPICYGMIGSNYMNQKCFEKAVENFGKAIIQFKSQLPNQFDLYAECVGKMTLCYLGMGKGHVDNAIECILKVIEVLEQNDNDDQAKFSYCYFVYGSTLLIKGEYDMSMKILNQALVLTIENKPMIVHVQRVLSGCFYEIADYQAALTYAKLSMETHNQLYSEPKNEDAMLIYGLIVSSCFRLNDFNDALSYALKYQNLVEKLSSNLTVQKASVYSALALIYSKLGNYKKADRSCETALNICEQLIKNRDEITDIGGIFQDIGELFINRNNFEKARIYYGEALKFYQQQLIDDHPRIQRVQSIIDTIPNIELEFQENMKEESQRTFIGRLTHQTNELVNYVSEKSTNLYRTWFPFH